jgi:hypothetical protein
MESEYQAQGANGARSYFTEGKDGERFLMVYQKTKIGDMSPRVPKGKQKAEPVRPTIAPEAVAKMSMGALALTSCLPAVKLL